MINGINFHAMTQITDKKDVTLKKEIKFRVWCTSLKRLIYNPYLKDIHHKRDQINDYFNDNNNKFIWMLYSNCKDKNNKEVYEGDIIVTHEDKDYFGNKEGTIAIIKFIDGSFIKTSRKFYSGGISFIFDEVVGNIYENPELVELCL